MNQLDVVIVHKPDNGGQLDTMLNKCVDSLMESEKNFNLVVINDGGKEPFCYNKLLAEGAAQGKAPFVALCNDDLIFHRNWFQEIELAYEKFGGQFRSFSSWCPGWHERYFPDAQPYYAGYTIGKEFCGWMYVVRRDVLDEIYFEHPKFQRVRGWYSDGVVADALKEKGIRHLLVRNSVVEHLLNQTMKTLPPQVRRELQQGQRENYMNK